jgi:hypothetical protein
MTPNIEYLEQDDDAPVGRILSRREVLKLLAGLGGVALLAACDPQQSNSAHKHDGHERSRWCTDRNSPERGGGDCSCRYASRGITHGGYSRGTRLCGAPGANRRSVLRGRETQPLRYPVRPVRWLG